MDIDLLNNFRNILSFVFDFLPLSPLQKLMTITGFSYASIFDTKYGNFLGFINYIVPFDIFVNILKEYIKFITLITVTSFVIRFSNVLSLIFKKS